MIYSTICDSRGNIIKCNKYSLRPITSLSDNWTYFNYPTIEDRPIPIVMIYGIKKEGE